MAENETIFLPIPRLVRAECKRCAVGNAELLAVVDHLPVTIPSLTKEEAPVCVKRQGEKALGLWRSYDGAMYRPFYSHGLNVLKATPAPQSVTAAWLLDYARRIEQGDTKDCIYEEIVPPFFFKDVNANRGIKPLEEHPIRKMLSDGLAEQADVVNQLSSNLILVGGLLWHKAPQPFYVFDETSGRIHFEAPFLNNGARRMEKEEPWLCFSLDEFDKLRDFSQLYFQASNAETRDAARTASVDFQPAEIKNESAFSAANSPWTIENFARKCSQSVIGKVSNLLVHLSDDAIESFVAIRRFLAKPPGEDISVLTRNLMVLATEASSFVQRREQYTRSEYQIAEFRAIELRLECILKPEIIGKLSDEDDEAVAELAF